MGHISEAELQRKPYIHKLGLNRPDISNLEAEIALLKRKLLYMQEKQAKDIDELGHYSNDNNRREYISREISLRKDNIAYYQGEIDKNEKLLEKLKLTRLQNKNSSNYTWKKQQKKWGNVTIKNRNNKAPLSEPLSNNQVQGPREDITNSIHDVSNNKERLSHPLNGT